MSAASNGGGPGETPPAPPPAQRTYRAACPQCGAAVAFASAASASAVCSFCRSSLLRDGNALRRIGQVAELFDDHSPLRLGVGGSYQGSGFTLVGRLQWGYEAPGGTGSANVTVGSGLASTSQAPELAGTWNEWHALFDNGKSGWLSEDNGAYVFAFDSPRPPEAPPLGTMLAGQDVTLDSRFWSVASVVAARLVAAEGELPQAPPLQGTSLIAELRNTGGEVATLDELLDARGLPAPLAPTAARARTWSIGRSVRLADLKMSGMADESAKSMKGRAIECPSCGAGLQVSLATTRSISCQQCKAVVDLSQGVGEDLRFYAQNNSGGLPGTVGRTPQIELGRTGRLALGGPPLPWQVVGYQERCTLPGPGEDGEQWFWREYLLYNRQEGFAFLVDSEDGWSWARTLTGTPSQAGRNARHEGALYAEHEQYLATTTWVQGEFYWRVLQGERVHVADFQGMGRNAHKTLSRESTGQRSGGGGAGEEVLWSAGEKLDAAAVAKAFGLSAAQAQALNRDAGPMAAQAGRIMIWITLFVLIFMLMVILSQCSSSSNSGGNCQAYRDTFGQQSQEYQQCLAEQRRSGGGYSGSSGNIPRTGGGSYGGRSGGGGGHK